VRAAQPIRAATSASRKSSPAAGAPCRWELSLSGSATQAASTQALAERHHVESLDKPASGRQTRTWAEKMGRQMHDGILSCNSRRSYRSHYVESLEVGQPCLSEQIEGLAHAAGRKTKQTRDLRVQERNDDAPSR
jgi:hypothetical protein